MTSQNLALSPLNERVCTSRTSLHTFKTTYGTIPMIPGQRYHFSVRIVKGSNFKIGVSTTREVLDAGFSDGPMGWAYYSNGSLRHDSKLQGPQYGESFTAEDVIGTFVDLVEVSIYSLVEGYRGDFSSQRMRKYLVMPMICEIFSHKKEEGLSYAFFQLAAVLQREISSSFFCHSARID